MKQGLNRKNSDVLRCLKTCAGLVQTYATFSRVSISRSKIQNETKCDEEHFLRLNKTLLHISRDRFRFNLSYLTEHRGKNSGKPATKLHRKCSRSR
mmetsp:Transcript_50924/g.106388  ORF Transcript_50924/g.106388 Transcript_50924/m.106388 type:complete len:96 (-) Transcript_50924:734-1021(-)